MKKIKKYVGILTALALMFGAVGCSSDDGGDNTSENASQATQNEDGTTTLKIQENGKGFVSTTGSVKTEYTGWTGTGYLDGLVSGGNVVYTVTATEAITDAKISIHYCNTEASRVRGALISVNGTVVNETSPIAMTYTFKGNKTDSSAETVAKRWVDSAYLTGISLNAGSNSIIIRGASAGTYTAADNNSITINADNSGCLNYIDYLIVNGKGIDYGTDTTKYVSLSCASENETAGSVESSVTSSTVAENSSVTFTATAKTGWKFECWSDGTTTNPYTKTISESTNLFAHFIPEGYTASGDLVGYATLTADNANAKYTISGGAGATEANKVTISTFEELTSTYKTLLSSDTPAIITISGTIDTSSQANPLLSVKVDVGSNKTIYGDATNQGRLRNIEFVVGGENVIIRNMVFGEVISWDGYTKSGADDALSLNAATHVWVDHCEFQSHLTPQDLNGNAITSGHNYYAKDTSADGITKWKKDFYDGLLDIKNGSTWITISNCYFHDHYKACLCSSGDSAPNKNTTTGATDSDMRITFVNNYWKNINARQPLFRWGKAHIFNSYFVSESNCSEMYNSNSNVQSTGINCRAGSEIYIDNNTFENLKTPIGYYNDDDATSTGYWVNKDNTFTSCTNAVESSTTSYVPPYSWNPKSASEAKTYVQSNAGVGKLSTSDLN